jgi:hypothetical protein
MLVALVTTLRATLYPIQSELIDNIATPLGSYLQAWGAQFPTISAIVWCITVIYGGMTIGRCGIRYSIYPAYTVIGMPIFGIIATGVMASHQMLLASAALLTIVLPTKYMLRYIMLTTSYSDLSLAMLYFGLLPAIYAPTAILYVALPIAVLSIKAHWRDWLTAVSSLLFPLFALCYWSWCAGDGFLAPAFQAHEAAFASSGFEVLSMAGMAGFGIILLVVVMVMASLSVMLSDKYALNGRARAAMQFNLIMILLMSATFIVPSATIISLSLLAVSTSSLIPLMFIKLQHGFTRLVYRLLMLMTLINTIILIFL